MSVYFKKGLSTIHSRYYLGTCLITVWRIEKGVYVHASNVGWCQCCSPQPPYSYN